MLGDDRIHIRLVKHADSLLKLRLYPAHISPHNLQAVSFQHADQRIAPVHVYLLFPLGQARFHGKRHG